MGTIYNCVVSSNPSPIDCHRLPMSNTSDSSSATSYQVILVNFVINKSHMGVGIPIVLPVFDSLCFKQKIQLLQFLSYSITLCVRLKEHSNDSYKILVSFDFIVVLLFLLVLRISAFAKTRQIFVVFIW